jgi:hypothetical protein
VVDILQQDSTLWVSLSSDSLVSHDASVDHTPLFISQFIRQRFMHELCVRALKDRPRGLMPLTLLVATTLLRSVKYPLLQHQSIHLPLSQLISVAARYELLYPQSSRRYQTSYASYKRRLGNVDFLINS